MRHLPNLSYKLADLTFDILGGLKLRVKYSCGFPPVSFLEAGCMGLHLMQTFNDCPAEVNAGLVAAGAPRVGWRPCCWLVAVGGTTHKVMRMQARRTASWE